MLERLLRLLARRKVQVVFNDLGRSGPVSTVFGFDRGTPIDRYYIENFLRRNAHLIAGRLLEVGGSEYSRRFSGGKAESFDVLYAVPGNKAATIVGDLTDLATLPENYIDCFICTQTLNFIFDVQKAVEGAHHLLKPGGVLLATVSGISQISRCDMERWGDYWRFTTESVKKMFTPVFKGGVEIESFGNAMAACAFLQGIAVEDLPDRTVLDKRTDDYQLLISVIARKGI